MTAMGTVKVPKAGFVSCDRCGARSKVLAMLPSGQSLVFCQHHANEHEAKLREIGAVIAERVEEE